MSAEFIDTLVVGGGQAGLAVSQHLSDHKVPHLILERYRIAERWRSERWDSLVANGPAWHDKFPGMEFEGIDEDTFPTKENIADYLASFAEKISAPVRCGVEVTAVSRNMDGPGFCVKTSNGLLDARNVVAATGPFQRPVIPSIIPDDFDILQIHSNAYRNPGQLPEGSVLVVGSGSSGVQIADELLRAGKHVYLSVGPHNRPPRRYRGIDYVWWLGVLGKWDAQYVEKGKEHVTIAVTGSNGGHTVDFRELAKRGMMLLGMTSSFRDGVLTFASDLEKNIAMGDADYLSVLDEADDYVRRNGLKLPEDPEARKIRPNPACICDPILELDLATSDFAAVIWATGYAFDFRWLKVDTFDAEGQPRHERGISAEPGIYFLGLPWLSRRGSSFIWGVWHDAKFIADQIAIQRNYQEHYSLISGEAKRY